MYWYVCYHCFTCPWTVYIFVFHMSERPFWGLVGEADSTPTHFTPAFWRILYLPIVLFCLNICLCWLLSHVRSGKSRRFHSWGSFEVFYSSELLAFHRPNFLEVFLLFLSGVFGGISEVVWGTWGLFPRSLILRISLNFIGGLPSVVVIPRPFVTYSWGFSEVLWYTALRLQAMSQEVLSLTSGVIVSWRRSSHRILFLVLWRDYSDGRLSSDTMRNERLILIEYRIVMRNKISEWLS